MNQIVLPLFVEDESTHSVAGNRFEKLTSVDINESEQDTVIQLALAMLSQRHRPGETLTSPEASARYLQLLLAEEKAETFGVVFLDSRHRIIANEALFHGTIDGASVYPRIVVQRALACNAAAVLLYHNHPSGACEISAADRAITKRLVGALTLVDIRTLDHIVVGAEGTASMAERGLM